MEIPQGEMAIAVDLDGVICEFDPPFKGIHHFGDLIPKTIQALRILKVLGFRILIHTARISRFGDSEARSAVLRFLIINNVPFDEIWPKPLAMAYIDDRGVRFENWEQALTDVYRIKMSREED